MTKESTLCPYIDRQIDSFVSREHWANLESMATLTEQEITQQLSTLDGWAFDGDAITRRFGFDTFPAAMDFMARAALKIDAMNHHPEWSNVYNRVDVRLTSHDAGGVTARDIELAGILDRVATAK